MVGQLPKLLGFSVDADGRVAVVTDYGSQGPGGNTLSVIDVQKLSKVKELLRLS